MSVIVPIYNAANFLRATVDCILEQTLQEIEVILVDDNSTDDSHSICQDYAETHSQVRAFSNTSGRQGVSAARNWGLARARGEYVAFVDHDDYVHPDMYEEMCWYADTSRVDFVDCSYATVFKRSIAEVETISKNCHPKEMVLDRTYLLSEVIPSLVGVVERPEAFIGNVVWNKIFRRSVLATYGIRFDATRMKYEDRLFVVEFMRVAQSGIFIDDVLYRWMRQPGSLLTQYNPDEARCVIENQIRYRELFGDVYDFDSPTAIDYRIGAIVDVAWSIISREPRETRREKAEELLSNNHVREWMLQRPAELRKPALSLSRMSLAAGRSDMAYTALRLHLVPRSARRFVGSIWRKWGTRTASWKSV